MSISPKQACYAVFSLFAATLMPASEEYEQPPVHYSAAQPNDAVQSLQARTQPMTALHGKRGWALVQELCRTFQVPEESQVLVFSKTSKQNDRISPQTPRAIYFNEEVYIGYTLGGAVELAAIDPSLGPVFYLVEPAEQRSRPPVFQRDQSCLSCHGGPFSPGVPGLLVRSVFPAASGHPILSQGSTVVGTSTPFEQRWGGWYVTGLHGSGRHRGNVLAVEQADGSCELPVEKGANVLKLDGLFDTRPYPRASSDIVALMVLEHQSSTQNVLTKAHQTALRAMHMQNSLQRELGEPVTGIPAGTAARILDHSAEDVLDALLFKDEAALPDGGIEGDEGFQTAFVRHARQSAEGRSLKDFQLLNRLFKYRCSYMIHGVTFTHLQPDLKQRVLARLERVLDAQDPTERFAYLGESERRHIRTILEETGVLPVPSEKVSSGR